MKKSWQILIVGLKQYRTFKNFTELSKVNKNTSELPEILVKDILKLRPIFIKIGQILSTRIDILPPRYIKALE